MLSLKMHKDKPKVAGRAKWRRVENQPVGEYVETSVLDGEDTFATIRRFWSDDEYLGTEYTVHGQGGWTGVADTDDMKADWRRAKAKIAYAWQEVMRSQSLQKTRHDTENGLSHYLSEDAVARLMYSALGARFKGMHMGVLEEILTALKKAQK